MVPPRRPRSGGALKAARIAVAVALVVAGASVVDAFVPATERRPPAMRVTGAGGLLACPIAAVPRATGRVHLANVGDGTAQVRVTWIPLRGAATSTRVRMAPDAVRTVGPPGPAQSAGAAAIVEYSGSRVVASHTLLMGGGGAAGACTAPGPGMLALAGLRTTAGSESILALVNPGGADADVTITLFADDRRLAPVRLVRRVVPGRSRLDFRLSDFAFNARRLAAVVTIDTGRVVAEALVRSSIGVSIVGAQEPLTSLVVVARPGTGSGTAFVPVGRDEAALAGRLITARAQGALPGLPPVLAAAKFHGLTPPAGGLAAFAIESHGGSPLAGFGRWRAARGRAVDETALEGTTPARRWASVVGTPVSGVRIAATIVNPGEERATVRIRSLTPRGASARTVTVEAGRLRAETLAAVEQLVAIEVDADESVVVVLDAVIGRAPVYAFALPATPLPVGAPAAVAVDPRIGIPAAPFS